MISDCQIGKTYSVPPKTIKFDQKEIDYNRRYTDVEYKSIKESIRAVGQQHPICINSETGLCEDGYTRVQVCKELKIDVLCKIIDGSLSVQERRDLYRTMDVGRDYSVAQKAVMAYKYMLLTGEKADVASIKHKVSERNVYPVITIAGLGRQDILDSLLLHGHWEGVKDTRKIATSLKKAMEKVEENSTDSPKIDYVDMINTAKGQEEFWKLRTLVQLSLHEQSMVLVNYLNLKYKLIIDEDTGEVHEG